MTKTIDQQNARGGTAMAVPGPDRCSDQADLPVVVGADEGLDLGDTTTILQGAKAFLGRAVWSGRGGVTAETFAQYDAAKRQLAEREAGAARELALLAAWGAETTVVGGVAMTNQEAQEARQRVIDNGEAYAQWAVKTGRIAESEKDDFIAAIRRKKELEEKRGRGTLSGAEAAEEERLDRSRAGQAAEAATADQYQRRGVAPALAGTTASNAAVCGDRHVLDEYAAFKATVAVPAATPPSSTPIAASVRTSGLNL